MPFEQRRKRIIRKESEFTLALACQRVEPAQFFIGKARVAHHDAAVGQAVEKLWKDLGEFDVSSEAVRACKGWIGAHPKRFGTLTESLAKKGEKEAFAIVQSFLQRLNATALTQPRARRTFLGDC